MESEKNNNMESMEEVYGKIFSDLINKYFGYSDEVIDVMLKIPGYEIKQLVEKLDDLQVVIYSNDHNPPHFHVVNKEKTINAKFKIEDGELISGILTSKQLKKVKAFYQSPRVKPYMDKIWNKRNK